MNNIFTALNDSDFNSIVRNLGNTNGIFIYLSPWDSKSQLIREFVLGKLDWKSDIPIYLLDSFEAPKSFSFFSISTVPCMVICNGKYRYKVLNTVSSIEKELTTPSRLESSFYN